MIRMLTEATVVGILGARIASAVLTGVVNTAAAMLTARILLTVLLGLSPLLVATAATAEPARVSTAPGSPSA